MPLHPLLRPVLAVSLGAIPGALSRFLLERYISPYLPTHFPLETLIVNVSGCFLMGVIVPLGLARTFRLHPDLRLLLTTGFLGSYTTFSSYELDVERLFADRDTTGELLYWFGSTTLGLLALEAGTRLAVHCLTWWEGEDAAP